MMKDGKFKEDSAAVLSYQLHALAVKNYLSKSPASEPKKTPRPPSAAVTRARREQIFYQRLALLARVFPLLIGIACVFILWDSQRRAERQRNLASVGGESARVAPLAIPVSHLDDTLARSIAPRNAGPAGSPALSRLQSLLRGEPSRVESGPEAASPMSAP